MKKFRLLVCGIASLCMMGAFVFGACDGSGGENGGDNGGDNGGNVTEQPEVGTDVGDLCPDFSVPVYFGESDETYSPEDSRGKVTVINFWGTWCHPCLNEMPHFLQLAEEYSDEVQIVAIHSVRVTERVPDFIEAQGWEDSNILFALDDPREEVSVYDTLDGPSSYPYTLILDKEGIIRYKSAQTITSYALLLNEILPLL